MRFTRHTVFLFESRPLRMLCWWNVSSPVRTATSCLCLTTSRGSQGRLPYHGRRAETYQWPPIVGNPGQGATAANLFTDSGFGAHVYVFRPGWIVCKWLNAKLNCNYCSLALKHRCNQQFSDGCIRNRLCRYLLMLLLVMLITHRLQNRKL